MSESVIYDYRLNATLRREAYLVRVSETTTRYFKKYSAIYSDLVNEGLEGFLPDEFARIRSSLDEMGAALSGDPEHAREISLRLGPEVGGLPALARSVRQEIQVREKERMKELSEMRRSAASELGECFRSLVGEIRDPVELDFAIDDLRKIESEVVVANSSPEAVPAMKERLRREIGAVRETASAQVREWKERKALETAEESRQVLIGIHAEQAEADAGTNPSVYQAMLEALDSVRRGGEGKGSSMDDIQEIVWKVAERTDAVVVDENCRRMVVRSVMDSLEKVGFSVDAPYRLTGEKDEVVIRAVKPSGGKADFHVMADGAFEYEFAGYEGRKCKADIDQVLPMLQEIYGVELSNERVIWQNPDRISKSARPQDLGSRGRGNG